MEKPRFAGRAPGTGKTPRVPLIEKIDDLPVWRVGKIDFDGPWSPSKMSPSDVRAVFSRLKSLETMTWQAIETGTGSHFVEPFKLIPAAQKRLVELQADDIDAVFSLRLGGRPRLWGMRIKNVFYALWWDPEHQICPSPKKHT